MKRLNIIATLLLVAGLVGCDTEPTAPSQSDHEFEAQAVELPAEAQSDLELTETTRESQTTELSAEEAGVDGSVTIIDKLAIYQREREETALIEDFVQTGGFSAAVVVTPADLGISEVTLTTFEEEPIVAGDEMSLVVPASARADGEVTPDEIMAMVSGNVLSYDEVTVPSSIRLQGDHWFPRGSWIPGMHWIPGMQWIPGMEWIPEAPTALQVLVSTGERTFEDVFGREPASGEPVEEGTSVSTERIVHTLADEQAWASSLGVTPQVFISKDVAWSGSQWTLEEVYNAGQPAPMGGATFGLGVLSTPAAEVDGQSVNPVADADLDELLDSNNPNAVSDLLSSTGLTDAETVEWLAGPEEINADLEGPTDTTFFGNDAEIRIFGGVVSGEDGPWGAAIHMARVEHEGDIVIAVGVHRTPVGTADVWTGGEATGPWPPYWLEGGAVLSAAAFGQLANPEHPFPKT